MRRSSICWSFATPAACRSKRLAPLLQRGRVALEPRLLVLELVLVALRRLAERLRELGVVLVLLRDVHRDDLADPTALDEHLLAALDGLLTLTDSLLSLLHGAAALRR